MKLIIGLGNPGVRYRLTRHNAGFLFIEHLTIRYGIRLSKGPFRSLLGQGKIGAYRIALSKPQTFMNLSGRAVKETLDDLRLTNRDLVMVHDDIDLETGRIKIKQRGGDGGHKGLRSVIEELGDDRFVRLRIGIGRPPEGMTVSDYVLSPFAEPERERIEDILKRGARAIETLLAEGVMKTMTLYNA